MKTTLKTFAALTLSLLWLGCASTDPQSQALTDMPTPSPDEQTQDSPEDDDNPPNNTPTPEPAPIDEAAVAEIAQLLEQWTEQQDSGLAAAVYYGGQPYIMGGWGMADDAAEVGADTIFETGSVTKMFTAALVHDAVERGELGWQDPVSRWLTDFEVSDAITVEHLVLQTSGLFNYTSAPEFQRRTNEPWTHQEIRALFESQPLAFAPGTRFDYSNSNYYLLGLILEAAAGSPFNTLLRDRITAPLGMERTGVCDIDPWTMPRAQGYSDGLVGRGPANSVHMSAPYAAGAICSTATDLSIFARAFYKGRWFSPDALASPTVLTNNGLPSPYTFATFVGRMNWQGLLSHGGNITGFTAFVGHFPQHDLTIVLLNNLNHSNLASIAANILQSLVDVERPTHTGSPTAQEQARWTGRYSAPGLPPIDIEASADRVDLKTQGTTFALRRVGSNDFETIQPLLRISILDGLMELEQHGHLHRLLKE